MATDEQIQQHCPELFDKAIYLEQIERELKNLADQSESLRSILSAEDQEKIDEYIQGLINRIQSFLSEDSLKFSIQHKTKNFDAEVPIKQDHEIAVAVANISTLLDSIQQLTKDFDSLAKLTTGAQVLLTEKRRFEDKMNKIEEQKKTYQIEIEVCRGEIKDLDELEISEGELNDAERAERDELKVKIEEHQQCIKDISPKRKKVKRSIERCQQKLDKISEALSEFLSEFNADEHQGISKALDLSHLLHDIGKKIEVPELNSAILGILQVKRKGRYTAYSPEVEKRINNEKREAWFNAWLTRNAVLISFIDGGTMALRGKVAAVLEQQFEKAKKRPLAEAGSPLSDLGIHKCFSPRTNHTLSDEKRHMLGSKLVKRALSEEAIEEIKMARSMQQLGQLATKEIEALVEYINNNSDEFRAFFSEPESFKVEVLENGAFNLSTTSLCLRKTQDHLGGTTQSYIEFGDETGRRVDTSKVTLDRLQKLYLSMAVELRIF